MGKFQEIKQGEFFYIDGETFKKTTAISYEDTSGFEIYLDPIREAKMTTVSPNAQAAAVKQGKGPLIDSQAYITDPQTRVQTKNPNFGKKIKKTKVQAAGDALTQPQPPKKIATPKKK